MSVYTDTIARAKKKQIYMAKMYHALVQESLYDECNRDILYITDNTTLKDVLAHLRKKYTDEQRKHCKLDSQSANIYIWLCNSKLLLGAIDYTELK